MYHHRGRYRIFRSLCPLCPRSDGTHSMEVLEDAIKSFGSRIESMEKDLDKFRGSLGSSGSNFDQLGGLVKKQSDLIEDLNRKLEVLNDRFQKLS